MASVDEKKPEHNNNALDADKLNLISKIQAERAEMRKFLVMKSTEQQRKEGVEHPVDTAYIENKDGKLTLKAVFDVHEFKPDEINVQIEDNQLVMIAQGLDDQENAIYRKTMSRKIDLPETVDSESVNCVMSEDGILTVSMPYFLPPSKQPANPPTPTAVPIISENGRRYIRLQLFIGPEFTMDDVKVQSEGHSLYVKASYEAEVGEEGGQVTRRELKKKFGLPESIEMESFKYQLTEEGVLQIEVLLVDAGQQYRVSLVTEEVVGKV